MAILFCVKLWLAISLCVCLDPWLLFLVLSYSQSPSRSSSFSLFSSGPFRGNREEAFSSSSSGRVSSSLNPHLGRLVVPVKKALGIGLAPNEEERMPEGSMRCNFERRGECMGVTTRHGDDGDDDDDDDECLSNSFSDHDRRW